MQGIESIERLKTVIKKLDENILEYEERHLREANKQKQAELLAVIEAMNRFKLGLVEELDVREQMFADSMEAMYQAEHEKDQDPDNI